MEKLKEILAKLKEKIAAIKAKIPFLKAKEAAPVASAEIPAAVAATPTPAPPKDDTSLAKIYRDGTLSMRLGVLLVMVLGFSFALSGSYLGYRLYKRWKASHQQNQSLKIYADQFEGLSTKRAESASITGLGKIKANAYKPDGTGIISLEIWVKCDNPKTAAFVQTTDVKLHDKVVDVLDSLYRAQVDLMENEGKKRAKKEILEALNKEIEVGKILEVYFHNLVMQ